MKTIIAILGSLSLCSTIVAQNESLTASYLHIDAGSDGFLQMLARETGDPSFGDKLDEGPGLSIEWRNAYTNGTSFGLEYIYFGTEASISGEASAQLANDVNSILDSTFQAGATEIKEEYATHTFMFNVAYDIEIGDKLAAYLGAGVGISFLNQEISVSNPGGKGSADDLDTVYTYQLRAGLRYALNEVWSVQGGVRYLGYDDFEFSYDGVTLLGEADATAFEFGVSYAY